MEYLHSDVETLERTRLIRSLRLGEFDVLVGINLLREGLDMPEVSLVAILDADKEGFLRSETSLIQTIGRAARNVDGRVIMYADQPTGSMMRAIAETNRRRALQMAYNEPVSYTHLRQLRATAAIEVHAASPKTSRMTFSRHLPFIALRRSRQTSSAPRRCRCPERSGWRCRPGDWRC